MTNALEIRDLCKTYDGFSLDRLNLTLPSGCIMGLIGENGAGKSTTIRLILDMIARDSGTITILGKDNRQDLLHTKEEIGVVLDEVGFSECLNAMQVGRILCDIYANWDQNAFEGYLRRLSVPKEKRFRDLSRGMKMKLGIAAALSHHPKLLILDEATNGLDPVVRDDVMDIFSEFTREESHAILMSSHIVSDLEKISDYIAFLHRGKLILCEEKDRLYEEYGIIRCSEEELLQISPKKIIGRKSNPYGTEAIVCRSEVPEGITVHPVDLEQLFIFMVKGEK